MGNNKTKIALFKPHNARTTNAFYSGQHSVFKYLQKKYTYEFTYFLDDENVKFDSVNVRYIKENKIKTLFLRIIRKALKKYKWYWKIPSYKNLDFLKYDVIVTEGNHYVFLDYFKNVSNKIILNDSMSRNYILTDSQIRYLNKYFNESLSVVVNDKISLLYKKNNLEIDTVAIGHAIDVNSIPFIKRLECKGRLISIGRLVPEKGFKFIIKAISLLRSKYPDIRLDIYGEGPLKKDLRSLIISLGLENIVFLKGFLPYKELILRLKEYDLFVSRPLEASHIAEAFSMTNMEAMANGLPVITSDCGGVPYVIKDRAVIVGQKDVSQVVRAIQNFIKDSEEVRKFSSRGRKYIEDNYSVEVIAKKWDKVIKEFSKNE